MIYCSIYQSTEEICEILYLHQVASVDLVEVLVLFFGRHVVLGGTCLAKKGTTTWPRFVNAFVHLCCTNLLCKLGLHLLRDKQVFVL